MFKQEGKVKRIKENWIIYVAGVLSIFKILLLMYYNWGINFDTAYDSMWYINKAYSIADGKWLGDYGVNTLIKNPGYAIFLAVNYLLKIPYGLALGVLIIISAYLFVKALAPIINNKYAKIVLFLAIVYNPIELSYPYRNAIVPWFALLSMASIIAIYLRYRAGIKQYIKWAILGFFSFGFFYILREDSIWLLPFMLVATVITIIKVIIKERKQIKTCVVRVVLILLPILGMVVFTNVISLINYHYYGIYTTNDRTTSYQVEVLDLIKKIDTGEVVNSQEWVSKEAMEKAIEVSPTLKSNEENIMSSFSIWGYNKKRGWADHDSCLWAMRTATDWGGYYTTSEATINYYKAIISELKEAYNNGTIKKRAGISLSKSSGLYQPIDLINAFISSVKTVTNRIDYYTCEVAYESVRSATSELDYNIVEDMLGTTLIRPDEMLEGNTSAIINNNCIKKELKFSHDVLMVNLRIFRVVSWISTVLACVGCIWFIIKTKLKTEEAKEISVITIGMLLESIFTSFVVSVFLSTYRTDMASYPDFYGYTQTLFAFTAILQFLGVYMLLNCINKKHFGIGDN